MYSPRRADSEKTWRQSVSLDTDPNRPRHPGRPLTPTQRADLKTLPHVTLFESQYKLEWMPNPWHDIESAGHWLLDIADSFNPDLIHLNTFPHASLPWNAPVLTVAHSCVLSWWQAVKSQPAPAEWNTYRRAVRDGLRASDLVALAEQVRKSGKVFTVGYNTPCTPHLLFVRDVIRSGPRQARTGLRLPRPELAPLHQRHLAPKPRLLINGNCPVDHGALSFFFDNGKIDVDGWYSNWIRCWHGQTEVPADLSHPTTTPVANFIDAILGRDEPRTSPFNGIVHSEMVDAMYQSAETGLPARPSRR